MKGEARKMNLSIKPLNLFWFVALLALFGLSMPAVMGDPIDPSIIVRGASRGSYPIDESVEVLELTDAFFSDYGGFFVELGTAPPLGNLGSLVFKNATGQAITQLTIQFAYRDFFGEGGYDTSDLLAFEVFFGDGSPFKTGTVEVDDSPGGFVTWTLFGYVPPAEVSALASTAITALVAVVPSYDEGYFELQFNDFPEGMTGILSVPEPGAVLLLMFGLGATGLLSRWRKAS
jgi:hypothetical protein